MLVSGHLLQTGLHLSIEVS